MIQKLFILNGRRQNASHRADVGIKSRRNRRRGERCFLSAKLGGCKGGNAVVIIYQLMSSVCVQRYNFFLNYANKFLFFRAETKKSALRSGIFDKIPTKTS